MSHRFPGIRTALVSLVSFWFAYVLCVKSSLSQAGSTPTPALTNPEELAVWLAEDDEKARIWLALAALSDVPISPRVEQILVEHLLSRVSPDELENKLDGELSVAEATLRVLGDTLASSSPPLTGRLQDYVAGAAFARSRRLDRRGAPFNEEECEKLLTLQFVDPQRFVSDIGFRERVLEILPRAFDPDASGELRDLLLWSINQVTGIDFAASERIEFSWRAVPRRSLEREVPYRPESWSFPDELSSSIEASFYSLPSRFFDVPTAYGFLENVRRIAPRRTIMALVDLPLREELSRRLKDTNLHLVETHGRNYTPWPRDPLILLRRRHGGVLVLIRSSFRGDRADDNFFGLELIQSLPETLDTKWGNIIWTRSPVPFHNGQVLLTSNCAWISLYTLEFRTLQLLGLDRIPSINSQNRSAWLAYLEATRKAGAEFKSLFGRQVCFVHSLPESEEGDRLDTAIRRIRGGAGFDMDSLLTLLEGPGGSIRALVGDVDLGKELLSIVPTEDLDGFRSGFGLSPSADSLKRRLIDAQQTPTARDLDDFLELMSETLATRGLVVRRLPILLVPVALLSNRAEFQHDTFLITWNNVVLEKRGGHRRAEGFASLLPSLDARAVSIFRGLGYQLDLLPPLLRSVILNGGYRCASQHLRARE